MNVAHKRSLRATCGRDARGGLAQLTSTRLRGPRRTRPTLSVSCFPRHARVLELRNFTRSRKLKDRGARGEEMGRKKDG